DVSRKLLQVEPDNVEANYQVAWLLNRMNKFQPSLDHLARLPSGAQTRAPALALRCANYAALDKAAQATAFGKQLMAAPDLTEADVLPIIPALTQHHQADLASTLLEGLVQRGFGSSATLNQLATVYEEGGRFREAREIL